MTEGQDRRMRFDRRATDDTGLAPQELLDARLPNQFIDLATALQLHDPAFKIGTWCR